MTEKKKDVYEIITDIFIAALEEGKIPWQKPWKGGAANAPKNYVSNKEYRGMNIWLLALQNYTSPYWLSFKQCKDKGGRIKKGEKGTIITFWSPLFKKDEETGEKYKSGFMDEETGEKYKSGFMLRYYRVWNIEQIEGLTKIRKREEEPKEDEGLQFDPIHECEVVLKGYKDCPEIKHGGGRACYTPEQDLVQVPEKKSFKSVAGYYATLFHELVHSTGHDNRLDRDLKNWFGSDPYAKEELVAEMGATFLNAHCGVEQETIDNSKAYIQLCTVLHAQDRVLSNNQTDIQGGRV
jgi:antirestriction protein ArdC